MSFLYPTLLAIGLPLVAVPIAIHLLNLRRQHRISWAAMQFLLESQRRNRTWVFLRQLFLLLIRMAAIAVLVFMLAGMILENSWARFFGTPATHHVILLDDSFSMSDRQENTTAFDRGKYAAREIAEQAHSKGDTRWITLVTFSEIAEVTAAAEPAIYHQPVNNDFSDRLESLLGNLLPSQTAVGLVEGLRGILRLPRQKSEETSVLHVISDFRAKHFVEEADLRESLEELNELFDHVQLIQCAREERPNLAITALESESGLRAADVESWMKLAVVNHGKQVARNVTVRLLQDDQPLPVIVLPDIPPNEEIEHRFRIRLAGVGIHKLVASLEEDAIEVDNHRFFASELAASSPVLLIDGSLGGRDAFYLAKALDPGGATRTGWQPQIESSAFLSSGNDLQQYSAIALLDVGKLNQTAIQALKEYVEAGGGLTFFLGENVNRQLYNEQLYEQGSGIFPLPLHLPTQLSLRSDETTPDVVVTDHSLFRAFRGERNSFLPLLELDYYFAADREWNPTSDTLIEILARTRDGAPLVVEKRFGEGRVIAHLTKLSAEPTSLGRWSNWSLNPVFPVLANELFGYLSSFKQREASYEVGDTVSISVDDQQYRRPFLLQAPSAVADTTESTIEPRRENGLLVAEIDPPARSGIYELELPRTQGESEVRPFALNVNPAEGDLTLLSPIEIEGRLEGVEFELSYADELRSTEERITGTAMANSLLAFLVGLLLCEQSLAYSAGYHPAGGREGQS